MNRLSGPRARPTAAALLCVIGAALGGWHASVLVGSADAPAMALLGAGVLLVVSLLLLAAGGWLFVGRTATETAVRTGGWVLLMTTALGAVGVLVSLHLAFMLEGFDSGPLVADLVTLGAAIGFLVGQCDARRRQHRTAMREERNRLASLFDNFPNPAVHYRLDDGDAVVLDANDAFEAEFGVDVAAARNASLEALLAPKGGPPEASRRPPDAIERSATAVEQRLVAAGGFRDFQVITVPYRDDKGFSIWIDVTERKLRVRRLEVLNRVLRHDLRTDAAVISGHADLLPSSPEAETIRERALAMAERGSDARRVAEALGDSADRRPLDLAALVERRTTDIDSATVQTHLEEATAYGSTALGMAVDELLENAIEHNDAADPTVRVTVDDGTEPGDRDRFVTLEIADDGPGLPRWIGRCSRPARRRRCSTPAGSGSGSRAGSSPPSAAR